jgi:hypothetical protein
MRKTNRREFMATAGVASVVGPAALSGASNDQQQVQRGPIPHTMYIEKPRLIQGKDFDWPHEVQVALPASYFHSDNAYPVLWVLDGSYIFEMAMGLAAYARADNVPEMIVVGVGAPRGIPASEFARRRAFEFTPNQEMLFPGLGPNKLRAMGPSTQTVAGGAPRFLPFLVDDVRTRLTAEYRMNSKDHVIFGVSGGGGFVGYALFAKPGAFDKYICGSPSLNSGNFQVFQMEEQYAATHKDLDSKVFFGAGEQEITDDVGAEWDLVGSMIRLAQTLRLRDYPSLRVDVRIFPGESHMTAIPFTLSWGMRSLWAKGGSSGSSGM